MPPCEEARQQAEHQGAWRAQGHQHERNRNGDQDDRDHLADEPPPKRIGHVIDHAEHKVAAVARQEALQATSIGEGIEADKEADEEREENIARGAEH